MRSSKTGNNPFETQKENAPTRNGLGSARPSRRTIEGHTKPCDECGAVDWNLDAVRGEVACNSCGLVVEDNVIDPGAEWTNHNDGQDRSRVGNPTTYTLADKGLNTTIDARDLNSGSISTRGMSSKARRDWRRRRVIDERSKTNKSRERNLIKANQMIRDKSGLPSSMQEETARLYRKLSGEGFVTGRSIAGVAAACVYLVARQFNIPKQIPDVAEKFQIGEKELSRLIRQVSRRLNMHKITSPDQYFDKFVSDLELPPSALKEVYRLWALIADFEEEWQGKKPMGIAAALIYQASQNVDNSRTQSDICSIAKVSEVTLRGINRDLSNLIALIEGRNQS